MGNAEFLAELHMHTRASDGAMTPEEAVRVAVRKGLCCVAVTDHDTFRGSSLAERISRVVEGPMIIHGAEIRTDHGDVLVYCEESHEETPRILTELRDWADDNNCILAAAHPFHPGRSSIGFKIREMLDLFDAIEVWNSRGIPFLNLPAMIIAGKSNKPGISGSDAHVLPEIGSSPTILPEMPKTVSDVLEWISKGLVKPSYGLLPLKAIPYILAWSIVRRLG